MIFYASKDTDEKREMAIEAWLEEALSTEGEEEGSYIVTGDAINAICNLALRAPRPEPKPEPREDKAETILKAWYASSAWAFEGMRGFKQRHPDLGEYLKQELGEA